MNRKPLNWSLRRTSYARGVHTNLSKFVPTEIIGAVLGYSSHKTPSSFVIIRSQLSECSQVQGAAFALQGGVDALLLSPSNHDLWTAALDAREQRNRRTESCPAGDSSAPRLSSSGSNNIGDDDIVLSCGSVTGTRPGGVGDRVCVDLIQSLSQGEGMLVGSSAKLLALVHAETFETGFVPARRVTSSGSCMMSYGEHLVYI